MSDHKFHALYIVLVLIFIAALAAVFVRFGSQTEPTPPVPDTSHLSETSSELETDVVEEPVAVIPPEQMVGEYQTRILALVERATDTQQNVAAVLDSIEKDFFTVRVPGVLRDAHLATLFAIQNLKTQIVGDDEGVVRAQVVEELTGLSKKISSYQASLQDTEVLENES